MNVSKQKQNDGEHLKNESSLKPFQRFMYRQQTLSQMINNSKNRASGLEHDARIDKNYYFNSDSKLAKESKSTDSNSDDLFDENPPGTVNKVKKDSKSSTSESDNVDGIEPRWLCKPRFTTKKTSRLCVTSLHSPGVLPRKRAVIVSSEDDEEATMYPTRITKPAHKKSKSKVHNKTKRHEVDSDHEDSVVEEEEMSESSEGESRMTGRKQRMTFSNVVLSTCLSFFNEASREDLLSAPRITEKLANLIVGERPFIDLADLEDKFSDFPRGGLVLNAYLDNLANKDIIKNILEDCKQHSAKIQKEISAMQANSDFPSALIDIGTENRLHPYQEIGVTWLALMHKLNLNAILADEMGLGKTIQIIAFLSYLKRKYVKGPHLVIVPSSTITNWMNEFKIWAPTINFVTYYGSIEERKEIRYMASDEKIYVILTTYNMVVSRSEDRNFFKRFQLKYVIYDEGHLLKNCSTARYRSMMRIQAQRKILLTGTPLQNNLVELISLMYFTMTKLFTKYCDNVGQLLQQFHQKLPMMEAKSSELYEAGKIVDAKTILRPYILRRLKSDVLDSLPTKHERVITCPMTDQQGKIYGELMEDLKKTNSSEGVFTMDKLMQLRQVANHPLLYREHYTDDIVREIATIVCRKEQQYKSKNPEYVAEDLAFLSDFAISQLCSSFRSVRRFCLDENLVLLSGKFKILDEILPEIKAKNDKVLIFSQFILLVDILEVYLRIRGFNYLRMDGSTPVLQRQELIDEFNSSSVFVFILSTKVGGLGINLTAANHVIIHDIDFNPYNDKQAEDRAHRHGQKKDVHVVRLISAKTVEEQMLDVALVKLKLEKDVTGNSTNDFEYEDALMNLFVKKLSVPL